MATDKEWFGLLETIWHHNINVAQIVRTTDEKGEPHFFCHVRGKKYSGLHGSGDPYITVSSAVAQILEHQLLDLKKEIGHGEGASEQRDAGGSDQQPEDLRQEPVG